MSSKLYIRDLNGSLRLLESSTEECKCVTCKHALDGVDCAIGLEYSCADGGYECYEPDFSLEYLGGDQKRMSWQELKDLIGNNKNFFDENHQMICPSCSRVIVKAAWESFIMSNQFRSLAETCCPYCYGGFEEYMEFSI